MSFDAIYKNLYSKAFFFAKSYVRNELVAEDLASEALIKLWEHMKKGDAVACPEAFLLTMLKNKALDYLKHETIKEDTLKELADIHDEELNLRICMLEACDPKEVFAADIQAIVNKLLANLPEQTQRIFRMSQYEDKSNKEIAEALCLSVKSIEYHITKVLKVLRVSLQDYLS
jgi:RNA polymerase sigma-70 factor (ECF subfamily)